MRYWMYLLSETIMKPDTIHRIWLNKLLEVSHTVLIGICLVLYDFYGLTKKIQCHILLTHWGWGKMRWYFHDILTFIFLTENCFIFIPSSLKFVPKAPISNKSPLVQIKAWPLAGDKSLSTPVIC